MTSFQQDAGLLDASVPLWKRELIVRRRAVSKAGLASRGVPSPSVAGVIMRPVEVARPVEAATSRVIRDNGVTKVRVASSNNNCEHEADGSSDSSEELQYGPGIVNRLKSKYLSLALRETQARPALANMRRYSSLENLLDGDVSMVKSHNSCETQEAGSRSRTQGRSSRRDSMKRARSVETLHRYDPRLPLAAGHRDVNKNRPASMINPLVNEEVVIVENKTKTEPRKREGKLHPKDKAPLAAQRSRAAQQVLPVAKELPPPDAVKQKLKIFESSRMSARLVKTFVVASKVQPHVDVNSSSAARTIPNTNSSRCDCSKPALSPKPNISENARLLVPARPTSPRVAAVEDRRPGRLSPMSMHNHLHLEPALPNSQDSSPASHQRLLSASVPTAWLPRTTTLPEHETDGLPTSPPQSRQTNGNTSVLSEDSSSEDENAHEGVKRIEKSALENIRKDGASVSFNFGTVNDKQRPYLPDSRVARSRLQTPLPARPESSQGKQVGVIRPILTGQPRSASPTSREAEKNLINRVKSIEQSTRKSMPAAVQARSESTGESGEGFSGTKVPGLWEEKKPWNQQQNTVVFNFSGNKEPVPDYIENDGVILRNKLRRPQPGESGIILLGVNADESSDFDTEEERLSGLGPPSPCNVVFEGANVLINGRSSMARQPRNQKLRITFCEVLTSTFEYPSESSLLEDHTPTLPPAPSLPSPSPALPSPLGGSSLASYTPSKVRLGSDDFQLGITRTIPSKFSQPATPAVMSSELHTHQEEETYLKPAQDGDTVAWSAETAADLLF